jgi:hypothetical protein
MKTLFISSILIFSCIAVQSQNLSDTIQIEKKLSTSYLMYGQKLTPKQLLNIMEINSAAYDVMKKAKRNYDVAQVFGAVGGALIGFPIGTAIAGGDANWLLAGVGAGLIGVAIPFSIKFNKNARAAVAIYNGGIKSLGYQRPEMKLGVSNNGLGLTLTF